MSSNPSSLKFSLQKAASPLNLEEVDHYITEYGKRGLWRRLKAANQQPLTPVNFNSRNELLDFLLDVDSGPFSFDSACFVQLLAYLLSGAKGSFSNTDRTGKTVGGVASDSEGMSQFQMLICYLGFPDLKVGNELPTYRRGIWLFRRGLDNFCTLNNTGVESFAFPAWKRELSKNLFVAGGLMETDLNLVLLKRCILSSWLRHGGNPAVNFSDAHWHDVREFIQHKSSHVWQGFLLTSGSALTLASDAAVMSVRTTPYDPTAAAAADQAAAAAALDDAGAAAGEDEGKGVIPSKDDLEMLILQFKGQNPDWGYKRMLTAVRGAQPGWSVSIARVKKLLTECTQEFEDLPPLMGIDSDSAGGAAGGGGL